MSKSIVVSLVSILMFASVGQAQKVPEPESKLHSIFVTPDAPKGVTVWRQLRSQTSALEKAWQKADDDERDKVRQKVHKLLAGQFEADMKRREKELEQIEARVDRLRAQLKKRVAKKDEIIELQAKQLTMSWDGLGWSNPGPRAGFGNGGFAYSSSSWAEPSAPPTPPARHLPPGVPPHFEAEAPLPMTRAQSAQNQFTEKSEDLLEKILGAAEEGDGRALRTLASKLAEATEEMESIPANDTIWRIYEEVGDTVDNKKFWVTLAKAAHKAADDVEQPRTLGNILDTAARCYHLGGKIELAIELQSKAVDASAEAGDGEPNEEIAEFLDELKELMEDDVDQDEDEDEDEEEEEVNIR